MANALAFPARPRDCRSSARHRPALLRSALLLLALLVPGLATAAPAMAEDGWMRVAKARSESDVSIWTRHVSGQQMRQFRGETHAPVTLEQAIALMLDMDTMPAWLWRCESARILNKVGPREYIVYLKFNAFWPLEDRDAVLRITPSVDPKTGVLTLTGTALPDYLPKMRNVVRVPAIAATFVLEPKARTMRLEMTGHFDPGGVVPVWIANMVITMLPKHSLTEMREILEGPYFRSGTRLQAGRDALKEISSGP